MQDFLEIARSRERATLLPGQPLVIAVSASRALVHPQRLHMSLVAPLVVSPILAAVRILPLRVAQD